MITGISFVRSNGSVDGASAGGGSVNRPTTTICRGRSVESGAMCTAGDAVVAVGFASSTVRRAAT